MKGEGGRFSCLHLLLQVGEGGGGGKEECRVVVGGLPPPI